MAALSFHYAHITHRESVWLGLRALEAYTFQISRHLHARNNSQCAAVEKKRDCVEVWRHFFCSSLSRAQSAILKRDKVHKERERRRFLSIDCQNRAPDPTLCTAYNGARRGIINTAWMEQKTASKRSYCIMNCTAKIHLPACTYRQGFNKNCSLCKGLQGLLRAGSKYFGTRKFFDQAFRKRARGG